MSEEQMRKAFEQWYAENAFDYVASPIGSRECGLQWKAWKACAKEMLRGEFICTRCSLRKDANQAATPDF